MVWSVLIPQTYIDFIRNKCSYTRLVVAHISMDCIQYRGSISHVLGYKGVGSGMACELRNLPASCKHVFLLLLLLPQGQLVSLVALVGQDSTTMALSRVKSNPMCQPRKQRQVELGTQVAQLTAEIIGSASQAPHPPPTELKPRAPSGLPLDPSDASGGADIGTVYPQRPRTL